MTASELRALIIESLKNQGFRVNNEQIFPPQNLDKSRIRCLHEMAVGHRRERSKAGLVRKESKLLNRIASGAEVNPQYIFPRLVEVRPNTEDELLFRYASLHWSIPVSSGYGRRIRFIVIDEQNNKLIGLFGLGDPVFNLGARDTWIGWDKKSRNFRLHNVMDAFVLGAVPPYSLLLCGKLTAMLVASDEVRNAFKRKYGGRSSVINNKTHDGRLALVTTTSALGRSSLYNRINFDGRLLFESVGFTKGSGEFHFSDGLYSPILKYALEHCEPTAKQKRWGKGFRNRREVVKKCLSHLGLSTEWLYHGIEREVFVIPLARNTQEFLCGEHPRLRWFNQPISELFAHFRERWLIPRAQRDSQYKEFVSSSYRLWEGRD